MTINLLKKALMEDDAVLVFAKQLNADHRVRACYALEFNRRKGFHVTERKLKQLRCSIENEGGIYLLQLKDEKILPATQFGEERVTELPEELEEETYQKLPRYDFTMQVQIQRLMKKIGFF